MLKSFTLKANPKGPKVAIISGIHGDELSPLMVSLALKNQQISKGEIKVLPFVNVEGLLSNLHGTKQIPDLNRCFENNLAIINNVKNIIKDSDILIDLHSHRNSKTLPYAVIFDGFKQSEKCLETAKKIGLQNFEIVKTFQNQQRNKGTLLFNWLSKGKVGFILEISNLNQICENEIDNVALMLASLNKDTSNKIKSNYLPVFCQKFNSNQDMIITNFTKNLGSLVKKEEIIGSFLTIKEDNIKKNKIISNATGKLITIPFLGFHPMNTCLFRIGIRKCDKINIENLKGGLQNYGQYK